MTSDKNLLSCASCHQSYRIDDVTFADLQSLLLTHDCYTYAGAELGGCQEGPLPPQNFAWPPKIFRVTSCHCIGVLHRPLTAPLVAKLAPPMKMSGSAPVRTVHVRLKQGLDFNTVSFGF